MRELARLDATAQAELLRQGKVKAEELVVAALERIDALNPLVRAFVSVDADRRAAAAADGPLAGVPFAVKDVTPFPGLRWSLGARLFRGGMPAPATPYSGAIEAAGLVTIGKTATSELGLLGSTETLLEGVTHNPWRLSVSAAGSSGGAAAAVAAGLVPLAHANDGGGSIRIPASVCGLFGFKPSRGRTAPSALQRSDFGDLTSDHCVSRSVRDSALFLSLTEEPTTADGARVGFVRDPVRRPLRVGAWSRTSTGEAPEPEVLDGWRRTVRLLGELGHEVEEVAAPPTDGREVGEAFFVTAGVMLAGMLEMIPALRGAPVRRDELEPFTWGVIEHARSRGAGALVDAQAVFERARRAYLALIEPYDVVLTPTLATGPWSVGHLSPVLPFAELYARTARAVGYTPIHNIAGCPAMSVPLHWTADGLPIGSHFAAAPGRDGVLLGLAYQLEEAAPWRDRWAPWSYPVLFPA